MYGKTQDIRLNFAVVDGYWGNRVVSSIETGSMYVDWLKMFTSK